MVMMKNRLKNLVVMVGAVAVMAMTVSNTACAYTQDELIAIWEQNGVASPSTGGAHPEKYIGNQNNSNQNAMEKNETSNAEVVVKEDIPVHEHKYTADLTTDPTCTAEGIITYTCSCGDTYTESQPKLEHVYEDEVTKDATCTEEGETTYTCTLCGDTYTESIPSLGHEEGAAETTKNPTCTETGEKSIHCKNCGEVLRTEEIEATGHIKGESTVEKEATMFKEGEKATRCAVCSEVIETEVIPVNAVMRNTVIGIATAVAFVVVIVIIVVIRKRKSNK